MTILSSNVRWTLKGVLVETPQWPSAHSHVQFWQKEVLMLLIVGSQIPGGCLKFLNHLLSKGVMEELRGCTFGWKLQQSQLMKENQQQRMILSR